MRSKEHAPRMQLSSSCPPSGPPILLPPPCPVPQRIAEEFGGGWEPDQLMHIWRRHAQRGAHARKGKWSQEEDDLLLKVRGWPPCSLSPQLLLQLCLQRRGVRAGALAACSAAVPAAVLAPAWEGVHMQSVAPCRPLRAAARAPFVPALLAWLVRRCRAAWCPQLLPCWPPSCRPWLCMAASGAWWQS